MQPDFGAPRQRLARCLVQKNHPGSGPDPGSLCRQTKIFVPREMEQGEEGGACRIMKNPSWPGIQDD